MAAEEAAHLGPVLLPDRQLLGAVDVEGVEASFDGADAGARRAQHLVGVRYKLGGERYAAMAVQDAQRQIVAREIGECLELLQRLVAEVVRPYRFAR